MSNKTSASGTRVREHEHKDIHLYKFTEDEINSVTNIDDEKKWGTLFNVFVGGMLSCIISILISVVNDERQWKYYTIATVVLFILSVFSWNEYIRFKNKREEKLKELLGEY